MHDGEKSKRNFDDIIERIKSKTSWDCFYRSCCLRCWFLFTYLDILQHCLQYFSATGCKVIVLNLGLTCFITKMITKNFSSIV